MEKTEQELTDAENSILDEACGMLRDFDVRFVQYPLIAGPFVGRCAMYGRIDEAQLKALLDLLAAVDTLMKYGRK